MKSRPILTFWQVRGEVQKMSSKSLGRFVETIKNHEKNDSLFGGVRMLDFWFYSFCRMLWVDSEFLGRLL